MGNTSCSCVKQNNNDSASELQSGAIGNAGGNGSYPPSNRVIKSYQSFIKGRVECHNGAYSNSKHISYY